MAPPVQLPTRKIGGDDVTAISFGSMGMGAGYRGYITDVEERVEFFQQLYDRGVTNWDTADVYTDAEEIIGKWFAKTGKRKDIFLATKFGFSSISDGSGRLINGSPEYLRGAIERSLARLQTDYIDLYYLHRADATVPIEETMTALVELKNAGKIRHIGLSEVNASTLRRAHAIHPVAAIQVEYSVFTLDIEDPKVGILKAARDLGVTVVGYAPLGAGMLTGRFKSPEDFAPDDFRRMVPRYSAENFPRLLQLVDGLNKIGEKHGATAGQVAIAWVLAQGEDFIPLPGTTKIKYLEENMGALNVKLSPEEVAEVRRIADEINVAGGGDRYPQAFQDTIFVDTPEWKGKA